MRDILRNIFLFFVFFYKNYNIASAYQNSQPPFLCRINTWVKYRPLFKKVENLKSWYCKNYFQKQLQLLINFAKCSIIDVWQGSEYAFVFEFEYSRVLNMPGLHMVLNMPEYAAEWFLNMPEYAKICVWMCLNLPQWLLFYFPIVIPCLLECMVTYFNVYTN